MAVICYISECVGPSHQAARGVPLFLYGKINANLPLESWGIGNLSHWAPCVLLTLRLKKEGI